jgi:hypothetical protein
VGEAAVVAHIEAGAITLLNAGSLQVRRVLRGFAEPRYTAASREGRYAFVTESGSGSLAVIDVLRGRVVRRLHVGGRVRHLSVAPSGRRLWIALRTKAERLAIVDVRDPVRPELLGRIRAPFLAARERCVSQTAAVGSSCGWTSRDPRTTPVS